MNIDTFLKIGHSHEICQDYILSGTDPFPYIILADGCSSASDSDIGARILCHTALRFLKRHQCDITTLTTDYIAQQIILRASEIKTNFYTNFDSLDATLIIAVKINGIYKIYMFGDGVVYWRSAHGDYIDYRQITFKPNAPGYLRYRINDYKKYMDSNVIQCIKTLNNDFVESDPLKPYYFEIHEGDVKDLMIASDGVESFVYKEEVLYKTRFNNLLQAIKKSPGDMKMEEFLSYGYDTSIFYEAEKELEFLHVCDHMTDFKLTKGAFVKRRVKKVLKEYLQRGFINDDDLSIGCFHEEW